MMRSPGNLTIGLQNMCQEMSHRNVLIEIGSHLGESARIFSEYFKTIVCVDPWPDEAVFDLFMSRKPKNVVALRTTSIVAAGLVQGADVVYIDGEHSYENVKQDILLWRDKCTTLCGHDYNLTGWPGVVQAVNEHYATKKTYRDTSWRGGIRCGA